MWGTQHWCKIFKWLCYCFANCDTCCQKRFVPVRELHYYRLGTQSLRYAISVLVRHLLWVWVHVTSACPRHNVVSLPPILCYTSCLPVTYLSVCDSPCLSHTDLLLVCPVSYQLNLYCSLLCLILTCPLFASRTILLPSLPCLVLT
jgi:hypothetical protein